MTEPASSSSEPTTAPVDTAPPSTPAVVREEPPRRSRLNAVAAWVGIVAGVVFIVAVIFFSGFVLGARTAGGHHGWGHHRGGEHAFAQFHRGPPPMMFPMGPREFPRPPFPFGPGGPGGPGAEQPGPGGTGQPPTSAPRPS